MFAGIVITKFESRMFNGPRAEKQPVIWYYITILDFVDVDSSRKI